MMATLSIIWLILAFLLQSQSEGIFPKLQRNVTHVLTGFHTVWAAMATRMSELRVETVRDVFSENCFQVVNIVLLLCIMIGMYSAIRTNQILQKEISGITCNKEQSLADIAGLQEKFILMIDDLQRQVLLLQKDKKSLAQNFEDSHKELTSLRTSISNMPVYDQTAVEELRQQVTLLKKENIGLTESIERAKSEVENLKTVRADLPEYTKKKLDEMKQEYHDLFYNYREYYTTSISCMESDFYKFVHWTNHKIGWLSYNNDYLTQQMNSTGKNYCILKLDKTPTYIP